MKRIRILVLAMLAAAFFASSVLAEEASPVSGNATVGVFNRYVFRGYELNSHSFVIQPSMSISFKGLSATLWSNLDSNVNGTQSLTNANYLANNTGKKDINETDFTLSYTYVIKKLSLTGGYIYYGTDYTPETEEVFATVSYDTLLKPSFSVYRDVNEYGGTYYNVAIAHSLPLFKEITLDLGASAGYFAGSDQYWSTYEASTGAYTGKKYKAFHDGMVKAGLTIPVAKNMSLQPLVQYWVPLSGKAKRTIDGISYNPNGKLDKTFVAGINLLLSF